MQKSTLLLRRLYGWINKKSYLDWGCLHAAVTTAATGSIHTQSITTNGVLSDWLGRLTSSANQFNRKRTCRTLPEKGTNSMYGRVMDSYWCLRLCLSY